MVDVLAFDTFGTVTDWHSGITSVLGEVFPGLDEPSALARDWRRAYAPALARVESGDRPWTLLDDLQRESLVDLLAERQMVATPEQIDTAVRGWHVIPGWPDSAAALERLKTRYTICALSNGNVALLTEMAKHNGFPWDFIGGSDLWRHYKPHPATYLGLVELMQVSPARTMMVATHASDLAAARSYGLRTAYIERPDEWGPEHKHEQRDPLDDHHAVDLADLADQLGC